MLIQKNNLQSLIAIVLNENSTRYLAIGLASCIRKRSLLSVCMSKWYINARCAHELFDVYFAEPLRDVSWVICGSATEKQHLQIKLKAQLCSAPTSEHSVVHARKAC